MTQVQNDLQEVFRDVFDDDDLKIDAMMKAADIKGWDSMGHINLIIAIEKRFGIRFAASEIATMRGPDKNVGTLLQLIEAKAARSDGAGS